MKKTYRITDSAGVHAKLAVLLVVAATPFECEASLIYHGKSVNLKSIKGVLGQNIIHGDTIEIAAVGPEVERFFQTITELMASKKIGIECEA
ncbi:HPr family phosphocarrier protein [Lysinibacillus piscis]|uniref:Phosphocarrier protein HPr n=1 Tax=Lysinibacillus piscis TaxID=2518931 RepID=A0ABQ5NJL8_9BACI|nr:HPr family phosphocarrier protein [Lysinibacillus sp. KH24]GLC88484.1 phosphocarrier protein HPr [Lysinibacillus sp. KH24]